MEIRTNNKPRAVLTWPDLSDREQGDFDWLETDESRHAESFVRYRGNVYALSEFMRATSPELKPWDGFHTDSAFSAVLIRFPNPHDTESAVMGFAYS